MIVRRVYEKDVSQFLINDQISVGKYTATAVDRIDDSTMLFCLDQYISGIFTHENLLDKMNEYLQADPNFKDIMPDVVEIGGIKFRVPYVGEMFGADEFYESDKDDGTWYDQWLCMKDRRNRVTHRESAKAEWGWLMNRVIALQKNEEDPEKFALVSNNGFTSYSSYYGASNYGKARPVFAIREQK